MLASLVGLLLLHFWGLEIKPIHHDESVNAWWLTQITERGFFPYDPTNYHGPLFFYIQWIFSQIFGDSLWVLRTVGVLFTCLGIFVLWKRKYKWGALAMALSPAFFFFSRSAIHEPVFVFFQLVFFLGILDFFEQKKNALLWISVGLVGSMATKETWVLSILAFAPGLLVLPRKKIKIPSDTFKCVILVLMSWLLLFSGFFQNFVGVVHFFKAFMPWLQTGVQGSGHDKPFWYWGKLLVFYEPVLLVSLFFIPASARSRSIYIFTICQFLIYSLIPYKTVWCLISLLWPLCLLIDDFIRQISKKLFLWIFLGIFTVLQLVTIYQICFRNPIQFDHPYVYVQSHQAVKEFSDLIDEKSNQDPKFHRQSVVVFLNDSWPFPWIFRKFLRVQYVNGSWTKEQIQESLISTGMIVTEPVHFSEVEQSLGENLNLYQKKTFILRDLTTEIIVLERSP